MEKVWVIANMYVASLRAIYLIHQQCHWVTNGGTFYSDHLLFERLYKSAQEHADLAAEKFIGLFGDEALDFSLQKEYLNKLLSKYGDYNGQRLAELALTIEKDFLAYSKQIYDMLKEQGKMTLGLDDMIMSIASGREEACYLLQQSLGGNNG